MRAAVVWERTRYRRGSTGRPEAVVFVQEMLAEGKGRRMMMEVLGKLQSTTWVQLHVRRDNVRAMRAYCTGMGFVQTSEVGDMYSVPDTDGGKACLEATVATLVARCRATQTGTEGTRRRGEVVRTYEDIGQMSAEEWAAVSRLASAVHQAGEGVARGWGSGG